MPKLPVDKLRAGDRLAGPVLNAGGQMLLPSGAVLTSAHVGLLKGRGILLVSIEARSESADPTAAPAGPPQPSLEQLRQQAAPQLVRFGDVSERPIMEALMRAVMKRRAGSPGS